VNTATPGREAWAGLIGGTAVFIAVTITVGRIYRNR
jgi:hypothetical protein